MFRFRIQRPRRPLHTSMHAYTVPCVLYPNTPRPRLRLGPPSLPAGRPGHSIYSMRQVRESKLAGQETMCATEVVQASNSMSGFCSHPRNNVHHPSKLFRTLSKAEGGGALWPCEQRQEQQGDCDKTTCADIIRQACVFPIPAGPTSSVIMPVGNPPFEGWWSPEVMYDKGVRGEGRRLLHSTRMVEKKLMRKHHSPPTTLYLVYVQAC